MSAASAAAVLGAVAAIAGAAAAFATALLVGFLVGFFFAAARRFAAADVCFFFVWDVESIGVIASPAMSRRAMARILRCSIEFDWGHNVESILVNTPMSANFTPFR
jgi:uncharacterized membrane protein YraQ (UPF0718 family)